MISVVIPLYNKEASIKQSLMSVLSQSCQDFEVVIVDDGSTDNSVAKVEEIQDSRIRLIRQENGGPSKARNTGVKNAKGEWILFLDADDELLPNAITNLWDGVKNHQLSDFICAPFYVVNNSKSRLACKYQDACVKNPYKGHFYGCLVPRTGALICKKKICLSNPFDERIRRFEDLEWLFRLYKYIKVFTISKPVLKTNIDFLLPLVLARTSRRISWAILISKVSRFGRRWHCILFPWRERLLW